MRTRLRFFAALLALLALTTSVVEQAWAAACAGMDGSSAVTAVAPDAGSPPAEHASTGHDSSAPDEHRSHSPSDEHRSHSPSDPASCPMAAATGMACGAAALPMTTASAPRGSEIHMAVLPATDEAPGSLALSSLFRPPRR